MRGFWEQSAILAVGVLACLLGNSFAAAAERPNILLITADDLGCQLSCYGEKRIATPRLDALAAEGVRFDRFYVAQSSCSASRSALLTGRWPHQNGQIGLAHLGFKMHAGQKTLPALLKSAGYRTGIIGKLHVEPAADFPWDWMPKEKVAAKPTQKVRWVAEQSRDFFASAKESKQPFFYYVNYFDPHGPYTPDVSQIEGLPENPLTADDIADPMPFNPPTEIAKKRITAVFLNMVQRLDTGMGMLLDELKAAGLAENTLVVFFGDNGAPVLHGKTNCYEPGVLVPLMVRWPGIAKPCVCNKLVSEVDLAPTLLAAAGIERPKEMAGLSCVPLLTGQSAPWRDVLFTEMNFHEPQQFKPQRSARDDRYKLLVHLLPREDQAAVELFDLQTDPGETKNLADDPAHAKARERLSTALAAWQKETADPVLDPAFVKRCQEAAARWDKLPRTKAGAIPVVTIPKGEEDALWGDLRR